MMQFAVDNGLDFAPAVPVPAPLERVLDRRNFKLYNVVTGSLDGRSVVIADAHGAYVSPFNGVWYVLKSVLMVDLTEPLAPPEAGARAWPMLTAEQQNQLSPGPGATPVELTREAEAILLDGQRRVFGVSGSHAFLKYPRDVAPEQILTALGELIQVALLLTVPAAPGENQR